MHLTFSHCLDTSTSASVANSVSALLSTSVFVTSVALFSTPLNLLNWRKTFLRYENFSTQQIKASVNTLESPILESDLAFLQVSVSQLT